MSTQPATETELLDQTRQKIRGLARDIRGLAKSEISPDEFFDGTLRRVVTALSAVGGAVWTLDADGRLKLSCQVNVAELRLDLDEHDQKRHGQLIREVLVEGSGRIVQPRWESADNEIANPTDFLLVLEVFRCGTEARGVIEVIQRAEGRPVAERGYLQFVAQISELADEFLKTRELQQFNERQALWTQLEQFARTAHESLDLQTTAYTVANEGRNLIGSDRVSVVVRQNRRCRVEAVSAQAKIDRRSNTVTLLEKLVTRVIAMGEQLWYTGDTSDLPPQIEQAIEAYVDESHSRMIAVVPLKKSDLEPDAPDVKPSARGSQCIGALVVEQFSENSLPMVNRSRVDLVADHSRIALANALQHKSLFLMPLWQALGQARVVLAARALPRTVAVLLTLAAILGALFLIPSKLQLHGRGTLEPVDKRDVFASVDGVTTRVFVDHGDQVHAGDKLAEMSDTDLDVHIADVSGRLTATQAQINSTVRALLSDKTTVEERNHLSGDLLKAKAEFAGLERQLQLYREKKEQLIIRSPVDGTIITWQARERLINRPVEKGQVLMTVADPSKRWEVELHMPEEYMGKISQAQRELGKNLKVSYILATDPGQEHEGEIREVHAIAEVQGDEGNIVMVRVAINERELGNLRPGAGVSAKIDCGAHSLGYVWFHDLISFVQSRVLFRW